MPNKIPSHNLNLSLDSQRTGKDGLNWIYIVYKYQKTKKGKRSDYKVNKKHWDSKQGFIHKDYQQDYPQEMIKELYSIKGEFNVLRTALRENKISYHSAFDKLLKKGSEEVNLIKFVEQSKDLTPKDRKKYKARFEALENKHLPKKYVPLTTKIIADEYACKDIAKILKEESNLDNNSIHGIMYNLDRCGRLAGNVPFDLFKNLKLKPSLNPPAAQGVEFNALMEGINEIKTLQDLEAYLFWLYSFCLLGLDANDILNIDESLIAFDKTREHYYPDAKFNQDQYYMSTKMHIKFRRKKNSVPIVMLVNLFPTLLIRDWLHYLITINRPEYAYKGTDRFRLFNFKTLTPTGAADMEGEAKKKAITDTYRVKTQKMFGGTLQQTRHTVTGQGAELGMSETELDRQLGHAVKGALKHYLKVQQIPKDVNHAHIIQEFGVLKILKLLRKKFAGQTEVKNSNEYKFFETKKWAKDSRAFQEFLILRSGELSRWSRSNEIRYQQLMAKVTKGNFDLDENGEVVNVNALEIDYPQELKDLIKSRKELISKQNEERFAKRKARMEKAHAEGKGYHEMYIEFERLIKNPPVKEGKSQQSKKSTASA
mgnify:FL=1